ncbi:unnamed protein product [Discula destructiva]
MRPMASHVGPEWNLPHDQDDHEPDLDPISEEEDDAHSRLPRHISFDSCGGAGSSSLSLSDIIDGLPTAVKTSLGPLRTIRRSASIRSWVSYFYEISTSSMGTQISHEEHAEAHRRTVVSTTTTEVEMKEQHHGQQPMNSNQKRRRTSSSAVYARHPKDLSPSSELVEYVDQERRCMDRFCGIQGQLFMNNTLSEQRCCSSFSQSLRRDGAGGGGGSSGGSAGNDHYASERRAYVQGVVCLLRALPNDLDDHERTDLRRAMPPHLLGEMDRHHHLHHHHHHRLSGAGRRERNRGLIQRVVATLIVQLVVPMQFFWALFVFLLGHAVYLERKYKLAELFVKHSGELGYVMGKKGVKLSGVIYKHGGARVGAVVTDTVAYVADGVLKGVTDGIREACMELREDADP